MKSILRPIVATILGLIVAFVLVVAVEGFSNVVHPFPADFKGTMEEVCRHVERYPAWVLVAVIPMWGAIALAGTWIANRIGNVYSAAIVGLLIFAAVVLNVSMAPYPIWFTIGILIVIPIALVAGGLLARRRPAALTP